MTNPTPSGEHDQHVIPVEVPEHDANSSCPCGPTVSYTAPSGARVWVHRYWHEAALMDDLSDALVLNEATD